MLRALRNREPEERALQVTPWGPWRDYGSPSAAGMQISADTSLNLLTVFGCVNLISDTIATLPRDVFRDLPNGGHEEVAVKPRWFEQPNPTTDIIEFLTQSLTSLLLDGNAYWVYGLDGNAMPVNLQVLDPSKVQVTGDAINGLIYTVNGAVFRGRLLHIKGLTRPGKLKGLSPVESARQSLGIGLAVDEFSGNFFKNGTTVSGVIQVPGNLTGDQARDMKEKWSRGHGGVAQAHLPGVLDNGATWNSISVTPEQAQFLQTHEYSDAAIAARMFLVDPSLLGISVGRGQNLTYANLEQRGIHLVQFTLLRWIIRLERALTFLLPAPHYMKFNVAALERADLATRYQAHRVALGPNQAWETVNEVRDFEEMAPKPGFDKIPEPPTPAPPAPILAKPAEPAAPTVNAYIGMPDVRIAPPEIHNHIPMQLPLEPANVFVTNQLPEPVIHNHQEATIVNMEAARAPDVFVEVAPPPPADVKVNVAAARIPAPVVNVESPTVNVAAAKAPIVNNHIDATSEKHRNVIRGDDGRPVAVEEWTDPRHKTVRNFVLDKDGRITGTEPA